MKDLFRNPKGTQDIGPEEQRTRMRIRSALTETFELYGCRPLETPILSSYDFLASKYGGGAEIMKEVYKLTDQGERNLALRYDLTMPFVRYIGSDPEIRFPFKRYGDGRGDGRSHRTLCPSRHGGSGSVAADL